MAPLKIPAKSEALAEDLHYDAAVGRVKVATEELQRKGIIDDQGRRVRQDLPADMQEDADRDFGG